MLDIDWGWHKTKPRHSVFKYNDDLFYKLSGKVRQYVLTLSLHQSLTNT